jgi:hypothetical protein
MVCGSDGIYQTDVAIQKWTTLKESSRTEGVEADKRRQRKKSPYRKETQRLTDKEQEPQRL